MYTRGERLKSGLKSESGKGFCVNRGQVRCKSKVQKLLNTPKIETISFKIMYRHDLKYKKCYWSRRCDAKTNII